MKAGRNDPCPCGSGKKYKKCCLSKDLAPVAKRPLPASPPRQTPSAPPSAAPPTPRPRPLSQPLDLPAPSKDPLWEEFESGDSEGRIAVFLKTLDDRELMDDGIAFDMLSQLHQDAVKGGARPRFAELVAALRERLPEVYNQGAHFYLAWCLQDALAESRMEVVRPLALELAAQAGRDLDIVHRSLGELAYHGQLAVLVEAMRVGWPTVKASKDLFPWAIAAFAEEGADCEIFATLEHPPVVDPTDAGLLDRIKFFIESPDLDWLRQFIGDVTGQAARTWTVDDFTLRRRKKRRDDWDDAPAEEPPDEGTRNLARLIAAFVGYLWREEGVPFPRGELVRRDLFSYFMRRHAGELVQRPSLLEQARHPDRKLPRPPKPLHPLCPERVTFEVFLAGLVGFFNPLYYKAAALFEIIPAWLRFLESRQLLDAQTRRRVVEDLRPLHASLLRLWETHTDDPALFRAAQAWPADAAKGPREPSPAPEKEGISPGQPPSDPVTSACAGEQRHSPEPGPP